MDVSVNSLSNDELRYMLQRFGYEAGPIVGTTRRVYENKLIGFINESGDSSFGVAPSSQSPPSQTPPSFSTGSPLLSDGVRADDNNDVVIVSQMRGVDASPVTGRQSPDKSSSPIRSIKTPEFTSEYAEHSAAEDDDNMEGEERFRFVGPPTFQSTLPESTTQIRQRSKPGGLYPDLYASNDVDSSGSESLDYGKPSASFDYRSGLAPRTAVPRAVYGSKLGTNVISSSRSRWAIGFKIVACLFITIFVVMLVKRMLDENGENQTSKASEFDE